MNVVLMIILWWFCTWHLRFRCMSQK